MHESNVADAIILQANYYNKKFVLYNQKSLFQLWGWGSWIYTSEDNIFLITKIYERNYNYTMKYN